MRPGIWDNQPVVAECEAETIDDAIETLMNDPKVNIALVEEDPRLADGWHAGDDHYADDWPSRANVAVYSFEFADDGYPLGLDDHPMLAIFEDPNRSRN